MHKKSDEIKSEPPFDWMVYTSSGGTAVPWTHTEGAEAFISECKRNGAAIWQHGRTVYVYQPPIMMPRIGRAKR